MNNPVVKTDLQSVRTAPPAEMRLPAVSIGFGNLQSFELTQRVAKLFASSTLVPTAYRQFVRAWNKDIRAEEWQENPAALANCALALSIAERMSADPLMVMQNLHIIEGRPSWSSVWIIASINQCGRFEPLRYDMTPRGEPRKIEYEFDAWEGRGEGRRKVTKKGVATIRDRSCIAWTVPKGTIIPPQANTRQKAIDAGLTVFESTEISLQLAIDEGWLTRNGSKWQTMPDQMLVYRAAAFFGRVYAPELLLGMPSNDEVEDIFDARRDPSGEWMVPDIGEIRPPATIDEDDRQTSGEADKSTGESVDTTTGEIKPGPQAEAPEKTKTDQAMSRQAFEDACAMVKSGKYDEARAICPADQAKTLEEMIANRPDAEQTQPAEQAQSRTTRRQSAKPVGGVD